MKKKIEKSKAITNYVQLTINREKILATQLTLKYYKIHTFRNQLPFIIFRNIQSLPLKSLRKD